MVMGRFGLTDLKEMHRDQNHDQQGSKGEQDVHPGHIPQLLPNGEGMSRQIWLIIRAQRRARLFELVVSAQPRPVP